MQKWWHLSFLGSKARQPVGRSPAAVGARSGRDDRRCQPRRHSALHKKLSMASTAGPAKAATPGQTHRYRTSTGEHSSRRRTLLFWNLGSQKVTTGELT